MHDLMYTTEADEWEKHESWDLPAGETASSILRCAPNQRQPEVSAQVGFIDLTGGGDQQETSLKSNSLSHDWHFYRATIQSFHTVWMSVWIKSFNFCFSWALAIQKRAFWPVRDSELHVIATAWLSNAGFFFLSGSWWDLHQFYYKAKSDTVHPDIKCEMNLR